MTTETESSLLGNDKLPWLTEQLVGWDALDIQHSHIDRWARNWSIAGAVLAVASALVGVAAYSVVALVLLQYMVYRILIERDTSTFSASRIYMVSVLGTILDVVCLLGHVVDHAMDYFDGGEPTGLAAWTTYGQVTWLAPLAIVAGLVLAGVGGMRYKRRVHEEVAEPKKALLAAWYKQARSDNDATIAKGEMEELTPPKISKASGGSARNSNGVEYILRWGYELLNGKPAANSMEAGLWRPTDQVHVWDLSLDHPDTRQTCNLGKINAESEKLGIGMVSPDTVVVWRAERDVRYATLLIGKVDWAAGTVAWLHGGEHMDTWYVLRTGGQLVVAQNLLGKRTLVGHVLGDNSPLTLPQPPFGGKGYYRLLGADTLEIRGISEKEGMVYSHTISLPSASGNAAVAA